METPLATLFQSRWKKMSRWFKEYANNSFILSLNQIVVKHLLYEKYTYFSLYILKKIFLPCMLNSCL